MSVGTHWSHDLKPWLCQGDLFLRAPLLSSPLGAAGLTAAMAVGPALLMTHDCVLDKTNKKRVVRAAYATFLPLRKVVLLADDRAALIRQNTVTPYEALYVGEVPEAGEVYLSLACPATVPLSYFAPELQDFEGEEEPHLTATANDTRVGTLTADQVGLLRTKWNAHWTGRLPGPQE